MKILKKILFLGLIFFGVSVLFIFWANFKIDAESEDYVTSELSKLPTEKTGLLLGTSKTLSNGNPNAYFFNRIEAAAELYKSGKVQNIIDGMFYGLIFDSGTVYDESIGRWIDYGGVSKITSFGDGYSNFMKGCVVDMLHFPLVDWTVPESWPIIGGKHIEFFKYIFNVADSAITVGAALLLIFRKKAFPNGLEF